MVFAKKSLGQHFLRSKRALTAIIEAGDLKSREVVLEIGPGEGVLTEKLLATGPRTVAVEKDDHLYETLQEKFSAEISSGQLTLFHEDILDFDITKLGAGEYKLIANIPYNITGAIIEKFCSAEHQPTQIVLLVQDEVAKRIVAKDGKESILSISVKVYGEPRYVEKVMAGSFVPAPSVNSAIISIENISKNFFASFAEKDFFYLLKAGFQAKRKKLSSNLALKFDKARVQKAFAQLSLDENARAEELTVLVWNNLARELLGA
jgi:16S rRNA (adenine1518-N6/adenine1519-N6)-dimethyltransferase